MKKLFTFLFCLSIFSYSFAQEDHGPWHREEDDHYYDQGGNYGRAYPENNFFVYHNQRYWFSQRNEVMEELASSYNYQIQMVINDWSLDRWEKNRAIRELQEQEQRDINGINAQCNLRQIYPRPYRWNHEDEDDEDRGD